jgi:hypothetical protein
MTEDIVEQYESGQLKGYEPDAAVDWAFEMGLRQTPGQYHSAADAVSDFSLEDVGRNKVSLPYLAALDIYPGCLPGGRQMRGSCVAWSTRNAAMVSFCAYLKYTPNPERYTAPSISPEGIAHGAFSTAPIYWFRRHGRDGWQCSAAAQVVSKEAGLLPNQNYPEIGVDLTTYSPQVEGKWGASLPPPDVRDAVDNNLVSSTTVVKSWDEARSLIASGYAISTCGMEAWEKTRDDNGYSSRSRGSWAHAMAGIAVDDRDEMKEKYGCKDGGLILIQNSWGAWNRGGTQVKGTEQHIPPGSFWARWDDMKSRYMVALGPAKGWPCMALPDWGTKGIV